MNIADPCGGDEDTEPRREKGAKMSMDRKPHIIIFNPDEMRWDAMGHMGNPAAVTPFLDRFAATEAVSFSRAYCQNPVCVPSRCSFLTGLYPHVRGHRTMNYLLRPGETTLFRELMDAGYYVWMNDRNDLLAGQIPGWCESHATEIYYSGQEKPGPGPLHPPAPGGPDRYSHFEGQLGVDERGLCRNSDDEVVDAAIRRIRTRRKDQPLCLFLGLFYPHPPYQIEEPYFSAVDRGKLPERIRPENCSGKSEIMTAIRKNAGLDGWNEAQWDELRAVYLGMCGKIDAQFARLVAALREEGIYDDSAIFFLSDHGDFTGDYGLPEKAQNTFEDCLTRVPLLVKPPRGIPLDPGISGALTELVDFHATVLDLAGAESSQPHFGRSLLPVLANRETANRPFVCCEGGRLPGEVHCDEYHGPDGREASPRDVYWPKKKAQSDPVAHSKGIMLREKRFKYVSRLLGRDELYDMETDPGETTNLIDLPEMRDTVAEMRFSLMKWLQATGDIVPYEADRRFTREMLFTKGRAVAGEGHDAEILAKIDAGADIGELMRFCASLGG